MRNIKEKYCLEKYIFCLSGNDPHKNLQKLIMAYNLIKDKTEYNLVIAGFQNPKEQGKHEHLVKELGLSNRLKFLGRVPQEDIPALYSGSEIFVFPSLYEGFGFRRLKRLLMEFRY